jgi:hypothetical protein
MSFAQEPLSSGHRQINTQNLKPTKMKIFYSWQSDSPKSRNHTFIRDALDEACKEINNDDTVTDALRFESSMDGVSGSPEVANTIFKQIDESHVFIADVTLVGEIKKGKDPSKKVYNPNVNLELGYAAGVLGWDRVICVMNEYEHSVDQLPFDVKNRRYPIRYNLNSGDQKAEIAKSLKKHLIGALLSAEAGTLNKVESAIRRMDQSCFQAVRYFASADCFASHPAVTPQQKEQLKIPNKLISESVCRLLDLGLIWTGHDPKKGLYAYHWTYLGKKVIEAVTGRTMSEIRDGQLQYEALKKHIDDSLKFSIKSQ